MTTKTFFVFLIFPWLAFGQSYRNPNHWPEDVGGQLYPIKLDGSMVLMTQKGGGPEMSKISYSKASFQSVVDNYYESMISFEKDITYDKLDNYWPLFKPNKVLLRSKIRFDMDIGEEVKVENYDSSGNEPMIEISGAKVSKAKVKSVWIEANKTNVLYETRRKLKSYLGRFIAKYNELSLFDPVVRTQYNVTSLEADGTYTSSRFADFVKSSSFRTLSNYNEKKEIFWLPEPYGFSTSDDPNFDYKYEYTIKSHHSFTITSDADIEEEKQQDGSVKIRLRSGSMFQSGGLMMGVQFLDNDAHVIFDYPNYVDILDTYEESGQGKLTDNGDFISLQHHIADSMALIVRYMVDEKRQSDFLQEQENYNQDTLTAPIASEFRAKNKFIILKLSDHNQEDGDLVSVYLNDILIQQNIEVFHKEQELKLALEKGENIITIRAENEGGISPNTALVRFYGVKEKESELLFQSKKGQALAYRVILK